jgi:hypothetical protein
LKNRLLSPHPLPPTPKKEQERGKINENQTEKGKRRQRHEYLREGELGVMFRGGFGGIHSFDSLKYNCVDFLSTPAIKYIFYSYSMLKAPQKLFNNFFVMGFFTYSRG